MPTIPDEFVDRLQAVAIAVAMPVGGHGLDDAIRVAEDLIAAGHGRSATLSVAALERGAIRSDAEPAVRAMLAEFDLDVPPADDEVGRYRLLIWMFAHANLPIEAFEGPFYARLVAWDHQDQLDRALVQLLHERDLATSPSERRAIEVQMRRVVREAVPLR